MLNVRFFNECCLQKKDDMKRKISLIAKNNVLTFNMLEQKMISI